MPKSETFENLKPEDRSWFEHQLNLAGVRTKATWMDRLLFRIDSLIERFEKRQIEHLDKMVTKMKNRTLF